jgi:Skp family chaperone for outer membrane proteins
MNRMFLAFLVTAIYLTFSPSSASAQVLTAAPLASLTIVADKTKAPQPAPVGAVRVAVINIGVVFNKYERANAFKAELNHEVKLLQEEGRELNGNLAVWQSALQKGDFSAAKKENYEEKIINARRRLEDLQRQARSKLGKAQEATLLLLWKDAREAVKTYATENGIELVLAYGDPKESELLDLFPNVNRKMQAMDMGASVPFFLTSRADISEAVAELLNRQYREKNKAAPADDDPR